MERTKQTPKRRRQWLGRIQSKMQPPRETRETRQNFWRNAAGRGYTDTPKGKMLKAKMEKRRAKNKRSRAARKRNR